MQRGILKTEGLFLLQRRKCGIHTSCRDEMLDVIIKMVEKKKCNEFTFEEVLKAMEQNNTKYKASTIRTHLMARCCKGTPIYHATKFDDYEKIDRGIYKLADYCEFREKIMK